MKSIERAIADIIRHPTIRVKDMMNRIHSILASEEEDMVNKKEVKEKNKKQ